MFNRFGFAAVLAATMLPFGCGIIPLPEFTLASGSEAGACTGGARWIILLDLSGSVSDAQRRAWSAMAKSQWAPDVKGCDEILILGVHEASLTAAPLLVETAPAVEGVSGLRAELVARGGLEAVRGRVVNAIERASDGQGQAMRTDLLGALHRSGPTQGRRTNIIIYSDAMHVDGELNMESTAVRGRVEATAERVIKQMGWQPDRFENARVAAILPPQRGLAKVANSRQDLKDLWTCLFEKSGGELVHFDTWIPTGLF